MRQLTGVPTGMQVVTQESRPRVRRLREWRERASRAVAGMDEIVPAAMTTGPGRLALLVAGIPYPHAAVRPERRHAAV